MKSALSRRLATLEARHGKGEDEPTIFVTVTDASIPDPDAPQDDGPRVVLGVHSQALGLRVSIRPGETLEALQELNTLIRTRAIRKYYRALVYGKTEEEGTLRGFMKKESAANTVVWLDHEEEGAYPVETRYRRKEIFLKKGVLYSLVDVELVTGKSHQIRVHFAHMGHPLLGDPKYGSEESKKASALLHIHRQMLHAYRLVFPAITGTLGYLSGKIFEAPLPEEMERLCRTGE